ncbi:MAG: hypothetical protein Q8R69_20435 [Telluria sp.]|nr:hypothetical protein [Telluria sp.]
MTIIKKVLFHTMFAEGKKDKPITTDLPHMSDDEIDRLSKWIEDIVAGSSHVGANKPSWIANGVFVPGTELYRDNNIWHYHCGPYLKQPGPPQQFTDNTLSVNNHGKTSGPVYHYAKKADSIILIGFSRLHVPFPLATSKKNPLRTRAYALDQTMEVPGF